MDIDLEGRTTGALARFAAELRYEHLPEEVVAHVKLCLLDTLGCGLFGSTLEWSRILRETLLVVDPTSACAIWGTRARLGAPSAALVNGAAVHAFELDDLHKESILHPGSVVAPAVFAAGDLLAGMTDADARADGRGAITALVAGYEVGARAGMSVGSAHLLAGWHPTGTHGTLAAAAASASLLGLSGDQTHHALGIAGSQSAGLMASQYASMVKRFHAGRAAQSGLYAALLAQRGYTGITNLFESEYGGYCTTFSPTYDLTPITEGLGERWEILRVGSKPYSTNGSCHPSIDILLDMLASERFGPEDVVAVDVHASSATVAHVGWPYNPDSVTTAQMNLPYIVAAVVTDGAAFVEQFTEQRIRDPRLVEFCKRVNVVADPEIDARGGAWRHATRIAVQLRDGRRLHGELRSARGSEARPLTAEEVRDKYRRLAEKVLTSEQMQRVAEIVDGLEELPELSGLISALVAS